MKICVLCLAGASPEIVFRDESLVNFRRLMDVGLYGELNATSAADVASERVSIPVAGNGTSVSKHEPAIWNYVAQAGKRGVVMDRPQDLPVELDSRITMHALECSPGLPIGEHPHTAGNGVQMEKLVADSNSNWQLLQSVMTSGEWDCLQFADHGLELLRNPSAGNGNENHAPREVPDTMLSEYYRWLDEQIGTTMEALDDNTVFLVMAAPGASIEESAGMDRATRGFFLLAAPNSPINGEFEGADVLNLTPTLLDLAGYELPHELQERSLVAGMDKATPNSGTDPDQEKMILDRLAGLGYV